jgi:hypothetical protein
MDIAQDIAILKEAGAELQTSAATITAQNQTISNLTAQLNSVTVERDALKAQVATLQDGDVSDEAAQLDQAAQALTPFLTNPPAPTPVTVAPTTDASTTTPASAAASPPAAAAAASAPVAGTASS